MAVEGWETKRLDQIGDIYSGSTPSTTNQDYWDGDIVWITPNDLSSLNTPYLRTSNKKITKKGLESCSTQLLPAGSITISSRAPIGYVAIPTVEFCTNQGCKSIKLKSDYDSEFMYYNINFHIDKLKKLGEGTTFAEISKAAISSIQIPFPKVKEEQTQIAAILSIIDKAIEQTKAIIAKQQRTKTGLMQDLLSCGIDEHGNIRSEKTHAFKDSPLGRIPVEWEPKELGKVAALQRGYDIIETEFTPGPYPVISSSGVIGYHSVGTSAGPNVVVGRKGSIGNVHYIDRDFWAHDTSLFVTNFFGNHETYVYYLFKFLELERFSTKSGSPSLNRNDIHPLLIGYPKLPEQRRIADVLSVLDKTLLAFSSELSKAKNLKTGLMQDLLTGKVRVTRLLRNLSVRKTTP
jgi:type I restriction enzyme, S subunit